MEENFDYIAFVDIDGVLNHVNMKCDFTFLQEAVNVLNCLYDKYNIQLVLSSSWRHSFTFMFMQKLFENNNIKAPLIDRTYIVCSDEKCDVLIDDMYEDAYDVNCVYSRESEIYKWIKHFKPKHFVILDDYKMCNDFLFKHQLLTSFWGCDESDMALRMKHLEKIEEILKEEVII